MPTRFFLIILTLLWSVSSIVVADEKSRTAPTTEDKKVIAVLEILELMEMVDDIELYKDMEYLTEGDPNEPQQ